MASLARRRTGREIGVSVRGETVTEGRPAMLTRALSNLVENAAKFDPGGTGPIEVAVAGPALEGPVRVEVRDAVRASPKPT